MTNRATVVSYLPVLGTVPVPLCILKIGDTGSVAMRWLRYLDAAIVRAERSYTNWAQNPVVLKKLLQKKLTVDS